jgi:hypothetical protein
MNGRLMPAKRAGETIPRRDVPYSDRALGPAGYQRATAIGQARGRYRVDRAPMAGEPIPDRNPGRCLVELNRAIIAARDQEIARLRRNRRDGLDSRRLIGSTRQPARIHMPQTDCPVLPSGREQRPAVTEPHEHRGQHPPAMPGQHRADEFLPRGSAEQVHRPVLAGRGDQNRVR